MCQGIRDLDTLFKIIRTLDYAPLKTTWRVATDAFLFSNCKFSLFCLIQHSLFVSMTKLCKIIILRLVIYKQWRHKAIHKSLRIVFSKRDD